MTINFCSFKPPGLQYFVMVALTNEYGGNWGFSFPCVNVEMAVGSGIQKSGAQERSPADRC